MSQDQAIRKLIKESTAHIPNHAEVLYVYELEHGKYYVGKTVNEERRHLEHMLGCGSAWTRLHKPIRKIKTEPLTSQEQETVEVKKLMRVHGIDNVRGGAYSQLELSNSNYNTLFQEFVHDAGLCFKCYGSDHMASNCRKDPICDRCGRDKDGCEEGCRHKTTVEGLDISKMKYCRLCGRGNHRTPLALSIKFCECSLTVDGEPITSTVYCGYCGKKHTTGDCIKSLLLSEVANITDIARIEQLYASLTMSRSTEYHDSRRKGKR